jgi:signal transduction histidine kinase
MAAEYSREQFADEVRSDRLNSLLRWASLGSGVGMFLIFTGGLIWRVDIVQPLIPLGVLLFGVIATNVLKRDARYSTSAGFFVVVMFTVIGIALMVAQGDGTVILPFIIPLAVFIVGTLFPPQVALTAAIAGAVMIVVIPGIRGEGFAVSWAELGAILLSLGAAGIAALVTADLYQIAEWAIFNYARERRIAGELFESRTELERSLARTRALTERLQETNTQLDSARAAAEEAKHFRGQFLANMSHELRTPLNAIIGFSETMLKFPAMYDGVRLPNAYEADLSQIYTSGQELLKLINDILDLSKVDAGKLEVRLDSMDVAPLIRAVMTTAGGLVAKKPVRLEADIPDTLPRVYADDQRVRQVLFNLYSNAAKFTDEGTITVRARTFDDHVQISVTDTGSGIAPENHELIFEEFKQAETEGRDPRSGAGLGLAISRQLLGLMNGRIWVESALGKGSTFFFTLPRADAMSNAPAQHAPSESIAEVEAVK